MPLRVSTARVEAGIGEEVTKARRRSANQWALAPPTLGHMEMYCCPDCGEIHDEPGEALLGHRVRCLACQMEAELAIELTAAVSVDVAA